MTWQHRHPALYQINTRVWLTDLSRSRSRRAMTQSSTASPAWGSTGVWLPSVWQTGPPRL
jgi:hypothetical protein